MSVDYIVASLPSISLDAPAPMTWERFCDACGETVPDELLLRLGWPDLETQLRNALAEARKRSAAFFNNGAQPTPAPTAQPTPNAAPVPPTDPNDPLSAFSQFRH